MMVYRNSGLKKSCPSTICSLSNRVNGLKANIPELMTNGKAALIKNILKNISNNIKKITHLHVMLPNPNLRDKTNLLLV